MKFKTVKIKIGAYMFKKRNLFKPDETLKLSDLV